MKEGLDEEYFDKLVLGFAHRASEVTANKPLTTNQLAKQMGLEHEPTKALLQAINADGLVSATLDSVIGKPKYQVLLSEELILEALKSSLDFHKDASKQIRKQIKDLTLAETE